MKSKLKMNNIMLDLETLDTTPTSVILSIGAVKFDRDDLGEKFYAVLDIDQQLRAGRTISGSTLAWWVRQDEKARQVFSPDRKYDVDRALREFEDFVGTDDCKVWGNGAVFDNVILAHAYSYIGADKPWKYSNDRCYRTVLAEFKDRFPTAELKKDYGVAHNALDDAIAQALTLQQVWRITNGA